MIELQNVTKSYDDGKHFVVDNLSLSIQEGEIIVLLGSSGCGKTTTLKMINRLIEPTSGIIKLDGVAITEQDPVQLRRSIGYVFQGVGLFPHMSVEENIAIVLRLLGHPLKNRLKRAHELLDLVDLDPKHFAKRRVSELSGGQQQRIGVARALANHPKYLLMDEPFGALDSVTRDTLQREVLRLNKELNITTVFVTHDIAEAFRLADRIVVMDGGKIQQVGKGRELIDHPVNEFVKNLISTNVDRSGLDD